MRRIDSFKHSLVLLTLFASALTAVRSAEAQVEDPDPMRFAEAIADFAAWDRKNSAPDDAILFVGSSIKPSKLRWAQWPQMQETNRLVAGFVAGQSRMRFVDVASPLLDGSGEPRDVFREDGLHLTPEGYRLWVEVLAPVLDEL